VDDADGGDNVGSIARSVRVGECQESYSSRQMTTGKFMRPNAYG